MTEDPTAKAFQQIINTVSPGVLKDYPQPVVPETVSHTSVNPTQETRMVAANTAMKAENVKQGSWTENLGPDEYVAVDDAGNVISRSDKATLERTHPNAALFGAKDFPKSVLHPAPKGEPIKDALKAAHDASTEAENAGRHAKTDELQAAQVDALEKDGVKLADGSKFDHDGDGEVGGRRKASEAAKQKSADIGGTKDQGGKAAASKASAKK